MSNQLQRISPFLWFDTQAEEAVKSTPRSLKIPQSGLLLTTANWAPVQKAA
jgi:predicted 3-demethylubiquinone-9 3-methyltransferase (glyoxalase superfamily)